MVAGITSLGGLVDLISTNDNAAKILEGKSARTHEIELGQGREESSSSRGSSPRAGGSWEDIRATQVLKGKQAASDKDTPTESEDEDVNSEEIREGMDRWGFAMGVRAGVSALGFAMGVVGIWGDGY